MNVALVQDWLDALRSGDYEQGNMQLKDREDRYCCLGVAAEACFGATWGPSSPLYSKEYIGTQASLWDEDIAALGLDFSLNEEQTDALADRFGLEKAFVPTVLSSLCMYMNDTLGSSFTEIADVVESVLVPDRVEVFA